MDVNKKVINATDSSWRAQTSSAEEDPPNNFQNLIATFLSGVASLVKFSWRSEQQCFTGNC